MQNILILEGSIIQSILKNAIKELDIWKKSLRPMTISINNRTQNLNYFYKKKSNPIQINHNLILKIYYKLTIKL